MYSPYVEKISSVSHSHYPFWEVRRYINCMQYNYKKKLKGQFRSWVKGILRQSNFCAKTDTILLWAFTLKFASLISDTAVCCRPMINSMLYYLIIFNYNFLPVGVFLPFYLKICSALSVGKNEDGSKIKNLS